MKLGIKPTAREQRKAEQSRGNFFKDEAARAKTHCEECGQHLSGTKKIHPFAHIAHIVPKRVGHGCPSVAENPDNICNLCIDCHTNYDNKGATFVKKMKIFNELKRRVSLFYHLIPSEERRFVPDYFKPPKKHKPDASSR